MDLGLLLGNTNLRWMPLARDGRLAGEVVDLPWAEWGNGESVRAMAGAGWEAVAVGSVRDDLLPRVEEALGSRCGSLFQARRDFPIPIENRYETPEQVGTDRLLNALAAQRRGGNEGSVVVDFGTAVSVSVVRDGAFQGGVIAPGPSAMLAGLREATPRLPAVDDARRGPFLSRDSETAIATGVYWQVVGGAREILRGICEEWDGERPRILATGGGAARFAAEVPEIDAVVPHLTCEGLSLAWAAFHRGR